MRLIFSMLSILACFTSGQIAFANGPQTIDIDSLQTIERPTSVVLGVPFAPGQLNAASSFAVVSNGVVVPSEVEPLLHWHFKDRSIRALRVKFLVTPETLAQGFSFVTDAAATDTLSEAIPEPMQTPWKKVSDAPSIVATLDPRWLTQSLLAGPQVIANKRHRYDRFVTDQYENWAGDLGYEGNGIPWLYDRPTTLFKLYLRTGRADVLREAIGSYRFYLKHVKRNGSPGWPACAGGWSYGDINPCDSKFVYLEPMLLAAGLAGESAGLEQELVAKMAGAWITNGWSFRTTAYKKPEQVFTERLAGLGLLNLVKAFEINADPELLKGVNERVDWLYEHQLSNPDGLPSDGAWRHSWQAHEGSEYDAQSDVRGASTWMSENIVDGLWQAWLLTQDSRIPGMLVSFARYLEEHGWITQAHFAQAGHSWKQGCVDRGSAIPWYWSSSIADDKTLIKIQNSEGWYSDLHSVELALAVAAGMYFTSNDALRTKLSERLLSIERGMSRSCARTAKPPRLFNWNNRAAAAYRWLAQNRYQSDS